MLRLMNLNKDLIVSQRCIAGVLKLKKMKTFTMLRRIAVALEVGTNMHWKMKLMHTLQKSQMENIP